MNKQTTKALVPRLRFPEFRDYVEWEEMPLRNLGQTISGLNGKSGSDFGYGKPYVTYMQVFKCAWIDFKQCGRVMIADNEKQNTLQLGDILFTTSSETPEEVGFASVLLESPPEPTYLNSFCFALRPVNLNVLIPDFSRYLFHSPIYRKLIIILAQGITRYNISKAAFLNLRIPIPTYGKEQHKIADCLTSIDKLINSQSLKLDILKIHKKGLIQQLFPSQGETVPKLRFPEFRSTREWSETKLGTIAESINERAGENKYILMSVTSGLGLIPQKEKFGREIAGSQYNKYYVIRKWDFAYNKSATKQYPEGYIAMLKDIETAAVPYSIFTCFRIINKKILPQFLDYLFHDNFHGKWLRKFIEVGARAHGSLNVDTGILFKMPIVFPSLNEQQKIVDCLSSLDVLIAIQNQKLEVLKLHKKGLMQQLFPNIKDNSK